MSEQQCTTNDELCSSHTSNSIAIPQGNRTPYPCCYSPADNTISANDLPTLSATYTDPDGDSGNLRFRLFNSVGTLVAGPVDKPVSQSQTGFWTVPSHLGCGMYYWTVEAIDSHGASSGQSGAIHYRVDCVPSAPTLGLPASGVNVSTDRPVLTLAGTPARYDGEGDPIYYQFQVASDSSFTMVVADSGPLPGTASYAVQSGALTDATTYWWRVRAGDYATGSFNYSTSASATFSVDLHRFGVRSYWPIWSHGPLSVNEATGNLIVGLPGPSYPTSVSAMAVSLIYNSRSTTDRGLGAGWTLAAAGADPPARLIDHNFLSSTDQFDAIERVSADGGSDYYSHVAGTNTYLATSGDTSQLTKNGDGTWTLTDPDGSIYTFGSTRDSDQAYALVSAEVLSAAVGNGKLSYAYTGTRLTSISDIATGRTLTLNWNSIAPTQCSDAIVCVVGPDAVTWKYIGDGTGGTSGRVLTVRRVWNGGSSSRDVAQVGYDPTSHLLTSFQNANDLNPLGASPGYNGTHKLAIFYSSNKVSEVDDGPISTQTPATSTWTFSYSCTGSLDAPAVSAHQTNPARTAAGCTTLRPPRQQPSGAAVKTFWDKQARPLEVVDLLGRHTETGWTDKNDVSWIEDEDGNPTDYSYDPADDSLLSVTAADPDGSGGLGRPVTQYRYDEATIGTSSNKGTLLQGVQASYYKNRDLTGRPYARQTDANVDFNWGSGGPSAISGTADDFSVHWTGIINAPSAGSYAFTTATGGTDERTRLTIDSVSAIDNWSSPQQTASSAPITLAAGRHRFTLDYSESSGSAEAHLRWGCSNCTPSISTAAIPSSALQPDWLNRTSVVSPAGRIAFSHYKAPETGNADYSLAVVGSTNLITSYDYDSYGRIATKATPKGNMARTIDLGGNLSTGTPDANYVTSYSYYGPTDTATPGVCGLNSAINQSGLQATQTTHGLATVTTLYDAAGRPTKVTNGKGPTSRCFDSEGRLTSTQAPGDTQPTTYSYDPAGNVRTATHSGTADDTQGTTTTSYDEANRVADVVDASGAEATYTYDADGNRVTRTARTTVGGGGGSGSVSFVQGATNTNDGYATSIAQAFTGNLTAGNLVVVAVSFGSNNTTTATVADSLGNSYTLLDQANDTVNHQVLAIFYAKNVTAGADTVTASFGATTPYRRIMVHEYTGADPTSPIDVHTINGNQTGTNTPDNLTSGSATTTGNGELIVGVVNSTSTVTGGFSAGSGETARKSLTDMLSEDKQQTTAAAVASTWTTSLSSVEYHAAELAIKPATTGGGGGSGSVSFVQGATNTNDGYATSIAQAFTSNLTGGNLVLVAVSWGTNATATVSDSLGNTYTPLDLAYDGTNHQSLQTFYAKNVSAGADTVTASFGATTPYRRIMVHEYTGADPTSPIDVHTIAANQTGTNTTDNLTSGSAITTGNGELIFGVVNTTSTETGGLSAGSGETSRKSLSDMISEDKQQTTAGAVASTWTTSLSSVKYHAAELAIKPATTNGGDYSTVYTYNAADQLTGETDPAGRNYSFTYDNRGNLQGTQYPNNSYSLVETNPDGWTTAVCNDQGTLPVPPPANGCPVGATKIIEYAYTYNLDGQKLTEQRTDSATQTTTYTYDDVGRLLTYSISGGTGASAQYCYDLESNRTQVTATWSTACGDSRTPTYTYNPANSNSPGVDQLTSVGATLYHYTADGQLDCRGSSVGGTCPSGSDSLRWDGAGTISGATVAGKSVCYVYAPDGALERRIYDATGTSSCTTVSATTNYLLGDLLETNATGTITTSYQDGPAGDLTSFNGPPTSASTPTYLYYNGHGDLAAETTGSTTTTHKYDPFGAPIDPPPANTTTHRYTGAWAKQDDTTTGVILMGARPYDPTIGRFLAADPIDGGSLNAYDYAGQDPVNGYDLDGTMLDKNGIGDCEIGSCGNTFPGNTTGIASPGAVAEGLFGSKKDWKKIGAIAARVAKTYGVSCVTGGAIAGAAMAPTGLGAIGGFAVGCAEGAIDVAAERHLPPNVAAGVTVVTAFMGGRRIFIESPFGKAYTKALGQAVCAAFYPACK